jgi:hypothetical protein
MDEEKMPGTRPLLTEVEILLKKRFEKDEADKKQRVPSNAHAARGSARIDTLTLPDNERAKMPYTKDKYLVRENPHTVQWEREVRKFLRQLSVASGHRISAVMIYEWATGIRVAELMDEGGSARSDLGHINKALRYYFGKPYMTYIAGRKVPNCYRVPLNWYVRRHRPFTLTLWAEYQEGSLYP